MRHLAVSQSDLTPSPGLFLNNFLHSLTTFGQNVHEMSFVRNPKQGFSVRILETAPYLLRVYLLLVFSY